MIAFLKWLFRRKAVAPPVRQRQVKLPEELGEEYLLSLEMHYGDEPLYYLDPPEWPYA